MLVICSVGSSASRTGILVLFVCHLMMLSITYACLRSGTFTPYAAQHEFMAVRKYFC